MYCYPRFVRNYKSKRKVLKFYFLLCATSDDWRRRRCRSTLMPEYGDHFDAVFRFLPILSSCITTVCYDSFVRVAIPTIHLSFCFPQLLFPSTKSNISFSRLSPSCLAMWPKYCNFLVYNCIEVWFLHQSQAGYMYSHWFFCLSRGCAEAFSNTTSQNLLIFALVIILLLFHILIIAQIDVFCHCSSMYYFNGTYPGLLLWTPESWTDW